MLVNILVTVSLFFTTKSFYLFYGVVFFIVVFSVVFIKKRNLNPIYLSIFFAVCLFSIYRSIVFENIEDFKELIKLIIFIVIIWLNFRISATYFFNLAILFTFANFLFSFVQFVHFDFYGIISLLSNIYNAENHIAASLSYAIPRVIGFSAGPGQQAVISLFFISYFSVVAKFSRKPKILPVLAIIFCLLTLIMTQSKTVMLALPVSLLIFYFSCFRMFSRKFSFVFLSMSIVSILFFIFSIETIVNYIPELKRVYDDGLNISSFQSRITNWSTMLSTILESNNFLFYLFGVGRSGLEFYNTNDIPYDSDYIYFLVNFGFLGLTVFVSFLIVSLIYPVITGATNAKVMFFSLLASFALVVSFSLNFYVEPRIYILIALFLSSNSKLFHLT